MRSPEQSLQKSANDSPDTPSVVPQMTETDTPPSMLHDLRTPQVEQYCEEPSVISNIARDKDASYMIMN